MPPEAMVIPQPIAPGALIARKTRAIRFRAPLSFSEAGIGEKSVGYGIMVGPKGSALVVEDNMIIAMEAEEILHELGYANCHVCGSVRGAMQFIADNSISFALLDIDLGCETSEEIAATLHARGTPFIFASGYKEFPEIAESLASVPVVTKPYTGGDIAAAIAGLAL
jgi:CheY-like chemotaxis protein